MTKQRSLDPDAPPTSFGDWRHAQARRPGHGRPPRPPVAGGLTFCVFRASTDEKLFVITDGREPAALVDCPRGGIWLPLKSFRETGDARVAISESEAKEDIRHQGFHLVDLERRHRAGRRAAARKPGLAESRDRYDKKPSAPRSPTRKGRP